MLEILQFIFSGFWIWFGSFLMLVVICQAVVQISMIIFGKKDK